MKEIGEEHLREVKQKDGGIARVWLVRHVYLLEQRSRWVIRRIEFDIDGVPPLKDPDDDMHATEQEALAVAQRIVDGIGG